MTVIMDLIPKKQFHAKVIGLFAHHEKFEKQLHVHRKKQTVPFHVKMQRLNHVSHKYRNHIYVLQNIYTNANIIQM